MEYEEVNTASADDLVPAGTRSSADTVLTNNNSINGTSTTRPQQSDGNPLVTVMARSFYIW